MIKSNRKFNLSDIAGRNRDATLEVNWNDMVKDCKYIKLTMNGQTSVISKEDYMFLAFMIADEDEQQTLINPNLTFTENRQTMISVQATRDIAKGDSLNIPVTISTNPKTGYVMLK